MSDPDPIVVGRGIVDYWREMLTKQPDYSPRCDHNNGVAVLAYIDALHNAINAEVARVDQLRDTIEFNREQAKRVDAQYRSERDALRQLIAEREAV